MLKKTIIFFLLMGVVNGMVIGERFQTCDAAPPAASDYEAYPPFMTASVPPLVMLVMGRNHKLYYEAYNDASDLDGDGTLDITYKPDDIDYYGYFDSHKYYTYNNARFEPVGATVNASGSVDGIGKMAPSGNYWSGDFLNYLTMSRMDTMRKVLYGGMRSTDTATETVLERAYIPRDAHSWGKEYESIAVSGYDIRDYTPLDLPVVGTRHLFASTSLADASAWNYAPLLRVLPNNTHRIWEWVAKERPVCDDSLVNTSGSSSWQIVPASTTAGISAMTQTTYDLSSGSPAHPGNHTDYDALLATYANATYLFGSSPAATIDGSGNPFGSDEYYLTIFEGTLNVPADGNYTFSVDGDDAVEFIVDGGDGIMGTGDDTVVAGYYDGHGECGCNAHDGTIYLTAGAHKFQFRHEELTGSDSYYLRWELVAAVSTITDYTVRVKVADTTAGVEENCKQYPNGGYKPIGLLQRHGESNNMYFGLLTGSYTKNTSGGVLRKAVSTITDEIDPDSGQFTATNGIINTIDTLRVVDFDYGSNSYNNNCGWIVDRPINEGECRMWGNPIGEMMYETLRYFSGAGSPTADFIYSQTDDNDAGTNLALPKASWNDPYDTSAGGFEYCAKPFMLVLSDINPTFDSDQLPGSYFSGTASQTLGGAATSLDVESLSDTIYTEEMSSGNRFVGQVGSDYDGACTAKSVSGFGDIRGLCPEEPTKQGSYYSAAVANYGWTEDMHATALGDQKVRTYAVGLASPLPRIEIPLMGKTITMVPFGKSVSGSADGHTISSTQGEFQPTNTIVDFFVEEINPYYGRFRINYEDVEQGADHDMDAIVKYEYQLVDASGNPVDASNIGDAVALDITLVSEYAAGSINQHMGYIISGTTADGIYLEVKDVGGGHTDYFLDTPNDAADLPLATTRRFYPNTTGSSLSADLLTNPLWYAAKWGGFDDQNSNGIPDLNDEWDKDGDGDPDTYFYVVNPLKLEEQLNKSFLGIQKNAASGTAASVLANNSNGEGNLIQAYFKPQMATTSGNDLTWLGYMQSLWVDPWGNLREDSNQNGILDLENSSDTPVADSTVDKIVVYATDTTGGAIIHRYKVHHNYDPRNGNSADCRLNLFSATCPDLTSASNYETVALDEILPIFEAGEKLRQRSADTRKIFTFIDGNGVNDDDPVIDTRIDESGEEEIAAYKWVGRVLDPADDPFDSSGEVITFSETNWQAIKPFLGVRDATAWSYLDNAASPSQETRVKNLINYIRGKDSTDLNGSPDTRSRTTGNDGSVWKLGDIVNSTPVSLSRPPDSYHLIYGDASFQDYLNNYRNRETVVYVGANDGMLHAFTSWVYDQSAKQYTQPTLTSEGLGDELWAYIPQTLLPHLKFLANPEYAHSFYVDMKPKVFDAQIIDDGTHYDDGASDTKDDWGTILLVGLNMGGKRIWSEDDFNEDGSVEERYFNPTYVCMDVTDPRNPRLLWERSYDNLAMTSSTPAIVAVGKTRSVSGGSYTWSVGKWLAVFGSGPTAYDGSSAQNGYIFAVDLKTGEPYRDASGHDWLFDTGSVATAMNSPVSFDKDLTYNVDGVYFGSIASSGAGGLDGKIYKVNTHYTGTPSIDPTLWTLNAMFDSPGPVSAPVSLSVDSRDNVWAFFGTGRYLSTPDKTDTSQQYFFGIKDPYFNYSHENGTATDDYYYSSTNNLELTTADLFDANSYSVYTNRTVSGSDASITDWNDLVSAAKLKDGWYIDLEHTGTSPAERVISKPTVLGGIVFAPGYTPNSDICDFGGDTNFYALYYESGTAYYKHILPGIVTVDGTGEKVNRSYYVGHGAPPPAVGFHIGREAGATGYLQMSTGEVVKINVETAFPIKSNITAWRDKNK